MTDETTTPEPTPTETAKAKKTATPSSCDPDELIIIGLDTKDGPEHPLYDDRIHLSLDENVQKNIATYGILENVSVRRNGEKLEVVFGRQRVRMAREIKKAQVAAGEVAIRVPVTVVRGTAEKLQGMMISENEARRADNAITRARKMQRTLDMVKDEDAVATAFACSKAHVKTTLRLLELSPKVQKAVEQEKLGAYEAGLLDKLPHEKQDAALEKKLAGKAEGRKVRVEGERAHASHKASRTQIQALANVVIAHDKSVPVKDVLIMLAWACGDASDDEARKCDLVNDVLVSEEDSKIKTPKPPKAAKKPAPKAAKKPAAKAEPRRADSKVIADAMKDLPEARAEGF